MNDRRSRDRLNVTEVAGLEIQVLISTQFHTESSTMKRTHATDSASDGKKKTRFVAPEDDPARFDEDVVDQLETARDTAKGRRGKVRTEGYESDSSDEGESVVRSRAKKP